MREARTGVISKILGSQSLPASARGSSFYYSFLLLPSAKRKAIKTIYSLCRLLDDVVDQDASDRDPFYELQEWYEEIESCFQGCPTTPLGERLTEAIEEFELPRQPFVDLIDGMEMDLRWQSYQTFSDLREYCYRAASTVGLICIEIFGYESPRTREYAVNLGLALQLTNIIRDLKEDAARGRIYIPLEEMDQFGYSESDLRANLYNEPFIKLMRHQHSRALSYFRMADNTLPEMDRSSMFAAEIMSAIYKEILGEIRNLSFDVYRNQVKVPRSRQMKIALNLWLKSKVKK
ncbi:MAG TPA: presqualene diphosphate synthase HpnD [Blastocatellia bacterium]